MKLPLKMFLQYFRLKYVPELAPTILPMKLPLKRLLLYYALHTEYVCISSNNFAYEIATYKVTTVLYTTHIIGCISSNNFAYEIATYKATTVLYTTHINGCTSSNNFAYEIAT